MLRDAIANSGWAITAIIALILFFVSFVAVVIYVMTRPKKEMDRQSQIPIDEGVVEPRDAAAMREPKKIDENKPAEPRDE